MVFRWYFLWFWPCQNPPVHIWSCMLTWPWRAGMHPNIVQFELLHLRLVEAVQAWNLKVSVVISKVREESNSRISKMFLWTCPHCSKAELSKVSGRLAQPIAVRFTSVPPEGEPLVGCTLRSFLATSATSVWNIWSIETTLSECWLVPLDFPAQKQCFRFFQSCLSKCSQTTVSTSREFQMPWTCVQTTATVISIVLPAVFAGWIL